jgi:hypothetical protein
LSTKQCVTCVLNTEISCKLIKQANRLGRVLVQAVPVPKRCLYCEDVCFGSERMRLSRRPSGYGHTSRSGTLTTQHRRPVLATMRASSGGSRPLSEACLDAFDLALKIDGRFWLTASVTKIVPKPLSFPAPSHGGGGAQLRKGFRR